MCDRKYCTGCRSAPQAECVRKPKCVCLRRSAAIQQARRDVGRTKFSRPVEASSLSLSNTLNLCKIIAMLFDFLVALRGLRRSPAFTCAAIIALALGVGANSTMFSIVNSVLLRPLPGYETGRLMRIAD